MKTKNRLLPGLALPLLLGLAPATAHAGQVADNLLDLSLEELGDIEISSVSRTPELLSTAPAAIYVITNEDIRRAGAVRIPEMLRLAPNLSVAQNNARLYSVTARGFSTADPNKLLVLIDGRTVYSPLHSAVYWDSQEIVPEDIARIEVISGPGGTLWGANAVNGVINITTRSSADSQGAFVSYGGGPDGSGGRARYGGRLNEDATYRVYISGFRHNRQRDATGRDLGDDYDKVQGGFRTDWTPGNDRITVQGDLYTGYIKAGRSTLDGHNLLARWEHPFSPSSTFTVQAFYDKTDRQVPGSIGDRVETLDIEARHTFSYAWNDIVWGGGYRTADGTFSNTPVLFVQPARRKIKLANAFVQDRISLSDTLKLTLGVKVEDNSYSGTQLLPSGRLTWQFTNDMMLWAAVSRAVRTPSRVDRELFAPPNLGGNPNFTTEKLVAYEAGTRAQLTPRFNLSVSSFYNEYDDLRSLEPTPPGRLPLILANGNAGHTYGVETWASYGVTDRWRLHGGFSLVRKNLSAVPGVIDFTGVQALGNDSGEEFFLRSNFDVTEDIAFDLNFRAIGSRPNPVVPDYITTNARLGWKPTDYAEIFVLGTNLFGKHAELGAVATRAELRPSVYFGAQLRY